MSSEPRTTEGEAKDSEQGGSGPGLSIGPLSAAHSQVLSEASYWGKKDTLRQFWRVKKWARSHPQEVEKRFQDTMGFPSSWINPFKHEKKYVVTVQGNLIKLRIKDPAEELVGLDLASHSAAGGAEITEFSRKSRKRLLDRLMAVDWGSIPDEHIYEVTLTYPGEFPQDGHEVKRHLEMMLKRLRRKYRDVSIAWKMEFQKRGAPHFHFIVVLDQSEDLGSYYTYKDGELKPCQRSVGKNEGQTQEISEKVEQGEGLRYWVQAAWFEVVGSAATEHFNSGVSVERVRKKNSIAFYLVAYVAGEAKYNKSYQHKPPESYKNLNRFWGFVNARRIVGKKRSFVLDESEYFELLEKIIHSWDEKGLDYAINPGSLTFYNTQNDLDLNGILDENIHEI